MKRPKNSAGLDFEAAVALVRQDYNNFLVRLANGATLDEAKEFTGRHAAARSALAHIEHLYKLAGPDDGAAGAARQATLEAARAALGGGEGAEDGDG